MSSGVSLRLQSRDRPPLPGEVTLRGPLSGHQSDGLELPAVAEEIAKHAIASIHDLHRALADANTDSLWWYLPVSEWQPFMSVLPAAIDLEARIATMAASEEGGQYAITVPNSIVADYLMERFSGQPGIHITADLTDRMAWAADRAKQILRRWFNSAAWLWDHRRSGDVMGSSIRLPPVIDTLLISRLEPGSSVEPSATWNDSYLGDLPDEAHRRTASIVLLLRTAEPTASAQARSDSFRKFPIVALGSYLCPSDIFAVLFRAFRFRLMSGNAEPVLARAAIREARNHVRAVAEWSLIEVAMMRFLSRCQPRQIVCMQENSAWEHAVAWAAQQESPSTVLTGFFHCPVMPSAFRYRTRADVRDRRPLFHRTIPLGTGHRAALLRLGDWEPLLSQKGSAFRNPQLEACLALHKTPSMGPFTVLAVLGGAFDNSIFLGWLAEALRPLNDIVITIKPHPAYDALRVLQHAGLAVDGKRIRLTTDTRMDSALAEADVVVYKGTTVSFAALAAGVPLIHVNDGGIATDDSLFDSGGLSVSVSTPLGLRAEIERLRRLSPQQRSDWTDRARAYLRSYYDLSPSTRAAILEELFPQCG